MSVIITLSPLACTWDLGQNSGTPSILIAEQVLRQINPNLLRFVKKAEMCDGDTIPIDVKPSIIPDIYRRIARHLGRISQYGLFKIEGSLWRRHNTRFYEDVLRELQNRRVRKVDLVYCHMEDFVEAGRRLGKAFGCPVVSHFYGTFMTPAIGRPDAYWYYASDSLGWKTPVDLRICHNDGTRGLEVASELGLPLDRFLYQLQGFDSVELDAPGTEDVSEFLKPGLLHVMTSSRLAYWKRVERLLRVIPTVTNEIKNVHFLIVGDGPKRRFLEDLCRSHGIMDKVSFLGAVRRQVVFSLMRRCDVFVSTNDLSNLSRGLKEAMYFGMCVVTLDTGDTARIVKDGLTGRLLSKNDTSALASALIEVLSSKELRTRLGKAARDYIVANEPTKDEIMAERLAILRALMTNPRQPPLAPRGPSA